MRVITLAILSILSLLICNCSQPQKTQSKLDVVDTSNTINISLISLIANPEKYKGHKVRVIGFLHIEFEGDGLYINKGDYTQGISKNAVWIDISSKHPESSKWSKISDHYVLIEGIFDSEHNGHMGMMSGSLKGVNRLELWGNTVSKL